MKIRIRAYTLSYFKWIGALEIIPNSIINKNINYRLGDNVSHPIDGLIIHVDDKNFYVSTMKTP